MVNVFQPLASDIHDWNAIPWIPPPTASPVVIFDIPSLGAGATQVLIPAQAGYQIQLVQLYVYYPANAPNSSLLFESADALLIALDVPAGTDVNEVVAAGTLLLAADVAFQVTNPGSGASGHVQGWVSYSYVKPGAVVGSGSVQVTPQISVSSSVTILTPPPGERLQLVQMSWTVTADATPTVTLEDQNGVVILVMNTAVNGTTQISLGNETLATDISVQLTNTSASLVARDVTYTLTFNTVS